MFISKKKHEQKIFEAKLKAMHDIHDSQNYDKLSELQREVSKLKKQVLKLQEQVKNGY
ncbi:hypothetical protein UFOVP45_67 [uncultured Caudovirales phage]|uniref:Lacal_2735 family protein n=1 Tax=uncultured Caudovirales phage TaxID=2100421 RepID=A0A6J5KUP6_9CAUD|nr:hypothetical protein UFOVP45_67 [uncultured Caudovirales phage]